MMYFKVLRDEQGTPNMAYTDFRYSLPTESKVGKWSPVIKELIPCRSGYHLCRPDDIMSWLGPVIYVAEPGKKIVAVDNKIVTNRVRLTRHIKTWNERAARLFACDCAARVLRFYEEKYPEDKRPREAIRMARKYANGKVSIEDLRAAYRAAYNAAYSAADSAAYSAAYSAADRAACRAAYRAAYRAADRAACSAAYRAAVRAADRAACSAAYRAAVSAADSAADSGERKWQTKRLFHYLEIDYKEATE